MGNKNNKSRMGEILESLENIGDSFEELECELPNKIEGKIVAVFKTKRFVIESYDLFLVNPKHAKILSEVFPDQKEACTNFENNLIDRGMIEISLKQGYAEPGYVIYFSQEDDKMRSKCTIVQVDKDLCQKRQKIEQINVLANEIKDIIAELKLTADIYYRPLE